MEKRTEKCKWIECPYLKEQIKSKEITLLLMIAPIIYLTPGKILVRRLMKLYKEIKGGLVSDMFRNEIHRKKEDISVENTEIEDKNKNNNKDEEKSDSKGSGQGMTESNPSKQQKDSIKLRI